MYEYPPLAIMLLTYTPSLDHPRARYAEQTLESVLKYITYDGPLYLHIADDGSPPEHVESLAAHAVARLPGIDVTTSRVDRKGYGASYNAATQIIHSYAPLILPLEDDWELLSHLDLDPFARILLEGSIGCVRMGYLGFTKPLTGTVLHVADYPLLVFDPECEEHHVFAGHPRVESRAWERMVGEWPEGLDAGSTEFTVAKRFTAREGVAYPLFNFGRFAHIGSVQAREDQS